MKNLILALMLLLPFTAAYSQKISTTNAVIISATDPTGNACSSASPNLTYGTGNTRNLYTCQGGVYAVSTGSGSVVDATSTVKGKSVLGAQDVTTIAGLGTCAAGNAGQTKNVSDGNKGQRTCRNTTGSTYAWIAPAPVSNVLSFGLTNDGVDTATAFTAALAAAASGDTLYFPRGTYNLSTTTFIWPSGVNAYFDDATFSSTATTGTIFTLSSNVNWSGNVTIKRASSSTTNEVTLVSIAGVTSVSLGNVNLENAHIGLILQNSSYIRTGTISGKEMDGRYADLSPGGDLIGIADVQNVSLGDVIGVNIAKGGVYLSVDDSLTQTENVQIGNISIVNKTGKCCGSALSIRNGRRVTVGNVIAENGKRAVLIQSETGDTAVIADISIGNIIANNVDVSGGAAFASYSSTGTSIKNVHVGNVTVDGAGNSGIEAQNLENFSFGNILSKDTDTYDGVQFTNCTNGTIGDVYSEDAVLFGAQITTSTRLQFGNFYIKNNSRGGVATDGVRIVSSDYISLLDVVCETTSGTGHAGIVRQTGAGTNNKIRSGKTIGTTTDGTVTLNGTEFASVREYRLYKSAAPTAGTWAVGDVVFNSTPAASGVAGWICTTAGTPGSWSAFYLNNQATGTTSNVTLGTIGSGAITSTGAVQGTSLEAKTSPGGFGLNYRNVSGTLMWILRGTGTETGSDAGYDLEFNARSDAAASLGSWFTLKRSNGLATFTGAIKASGGVNFTNLAYSQTAPTVTSAGTSPSIAANNGTAAFTVNVGTGGTATTIVLGMPTAAAGWICHATNITATAANRADQAVRLTASTTTSVTLQNQTVSTGAALAFTASDVVRCQCTAY